MPNALISHVEDHILHIRINRPEAMNTFNAEVVDGFRAAWDQFNKDDDLRVAILSATGDRAFSAGVDLKSPVSVPELASILPGLGVEVKKPVIAAVSGHCLGVGLVMCLAADLRLATPSAKFGYPEPKVGITGGIASALPRYLPRAVAMEMLFTGDSMDAQRAYEVGFVNRLVEPENLMAEAEKLARRIASNAPRVVGVLKELVLMADTPTPFERAASADRLLAPLRGSADEIEGRLAFLEKRAPIFTGKL